MLEERPDLLDLLARISPENQSELFLDSFRFRKGQPVRIEGRAKQESHYAFLKALQEAEFVDEVKLESPVFDERKKETSFTITFHYRDWTRPRAINSMLQQ